MKPNFVMGIMRRASADAVCPMAGLPARLRFRDWLVPWRARRLLLEARGAVAVHYARAETLARGRKPDGNPWVDVLMTSWGAPGLGADGTFPVEGGQ
jgi:hypothetical protein